MNKLQVMIINKLKKNESESGGRKVRGGVSFKELYEELNVPEYELKAAIDDMVRNEQVEIIFNTIYLK